MDFSFPMHEVVWRSLKVSSATELLRRKGASIFHKLHHLLRKLKEEIFRSPAFWIWNQTPDLQRHMQHLAGVFDEECHWHLKHGVSVNNELMHYEPDVWSLWCTKDFQPETSPSVILWFSFLLKFLFVCQIDTLSRVFVCQKSTCSSSLREQGSKLLHHSLTYRRNMHSY